MMRAILFLLLFHSSYCSWFSLWSSESSAENNEAEQKFVEEMNSKIQAVQALKQQVEEMNQSLSPWNFLNFSTLFQFWNWFSKVRLILSILWSVFKRDHVVSKLKQAQRSLETERFLWERWRTIDTICEEAFEHPFFKKVIWNLVESIDRKRLDRITVTTSQQQFLRPVIICQTSSNFKKFPVFISAAQDFNRKSNFAFFVFNQDGNRYKVIAYLVKK